MICVRLPMHLLARTLYLLRHRRRPRRCHLRLRLRPRRVRPARSRAALRFLGTAPTPGMDNLAERPPTEIPAVTWPPPAGRLRRPQR